MEKRLIIDIMAFRQTYKAREINEIRWIKKDDNLINTIIKVTFNYIFKNLV